MVAKILFGLCSKKGVVAQVMTKEAYVPRVFKRPSLRPPPIEMVVKGQRPKMQPLKFRIDQEKQEVIFRTPDWDECSIGVARNEMLVRIDEWVEANLPYSAALPHPSKKIAKRKLRQWLNKNLTQRWTFVSEGIAFESQIDGTFYKLFWV